MTLPEDAPRREPLSPQEALPPVEPPNLGLIVRLFLVPLLIVGVVVLVVLGVHYLATSSWDPEAYLNQLEQGGPGSWQLAYDFSTQLASREDIRRNPKVAARLAAILERRLQEPPPEDSGQGPLDDETKLRIYLVKALGEFETPAGFDVLLRAVALRRNATEEQVQLAAAEALATLAFHVLGAGGSLPPQVPQKLLELSRHADPRLRARAAYGLGVLGQQPPPEVEKRLLQLLDDAVVDVRYNAALALGRYGDPRAVPVLVQMLAPQQPEALDLEKNATGRQVKLASIHINALRVALLLARKNPQADLQPLVQPARRLAQSPDAPAQVRMRARELLNVLRQRGE